MINLRDPYEAYFDDSGTHDSSPIVVAACYVARKSQWDWLTKDWNRIREKHGFEFFHMTDFVASWNPANEVAPYSGWCPEKKLRVYDSLAATIRTRAQHGFAFAVRKQDYDDFLPEELRKHIGRDHYCWAARCVLGEIANWRSKWHITEPMQYVFSHQSKGRGEIMDVWDADLDDPDSITKIGMSRDGCGFQSMRTFPPLQAADILAWNMLDHQKNVINKGRRDIEDTSRWFAPLRDGRAVSLGFITREQMQKFGYNIAAYVARTGHYPSARAERLIRKEKEKNARKNHRVRQLQQPDGQADPRPS